VTDQNLFAPPEAPADPPTVAVPAAPRRRSGRRQVLIGAALLVLLVVGGVTAVLLSSGGSGGTEPVSRVAAGGTGAAATPAPPAGDPRNAGGARGGTKGLGGDTLLVGNLVSTADGTIVVAQDGGLERAIHTDGSTRVLGGGKKGLAGLQPGDRVVVRVAGSGDAATAVTVQSPKPRVTGTVTALAGDTATVLRGDGLSVPVNIGAVNPKPAVGDLVVISGKAEGPGITADRLRVLPKAP
jgi:hypothetical protein